MLTGDFETHKHHVYKGGGVEVLKAAAIYGANGAGKSNLVKAVGYLQSLVKEGALISSINSKKFKLDSSYQKKPVRFEIEFFTNGKLYSYGVVIDGATVPEEWLYELMLAKEDRLIFERKVDSSGKSKLTFAKEYQKTQKQKLLIELLEDNLLKESQLLLGKDEELKVDEINAARRWIISKLTIIHPESLLPTEPTMYLLADRKRPDSFTVSFIDDFLSAIDTGVIRLENRKVDIEDLSMSEALKREVAEALDNEQFVLRTIENKLIKFKREGGKDVALKIVAVHKVGENSDIEIEFDLSEESDGTRRIFDYVPYVIYYVFGSNTIFIDEIDRSIHPTLIKSLTKSILDIENTKGQLIFTTHESNLLDLDIFRQDEIWFAEKERATGATHFYSLSEFKPDYDSDIEKGYLNGRFGAIPFLGNLENLNWHPHAETE